MEPCSLLVYPSQDAPSPCHSSSSSFDSSNSFDSVIPSSSERPWYDYLASSRAGYILSQERENGSTKMLACWPSNVTFVLTSSLSCHHPSTATIYPTCTGEGSFRVVAFAYERESNAPPPLFPIEIWRMKNLKWRVTLYVWHASNVNWNAIKMRIILDTTFHPIYADYAVHLTPISIPKNSLTYSTSNDPSSSNPDLREKETISTISKNKSRSIRFQMFNREWFFKKIEELGESPFISHPISTSTSLSMERIDRRIGGEGGEGEGEEMKVEKEVVVKAMKRPVGKSGLGGPLIWVGVSEDEEEEDEEDEDGNSFGSLESLDTMDSEMSTAGDNVSVISMSSIVSGISKGEEIEREIEGEREMIQVNLKLTKMMDLDIENWMRNENHKDLDEEIEAESEEGMGDETMVQEFSRDSPTVSLDTPPDENVEILESLKCFEGKGEGEEKEEGFKRFEMGGKKESEMEAKKLIGLGFDVEVKDDSTLSKVNEDISDVDMKPLDTSQSLTSHSSLSPSTISSSTLYLIPTPPVVGRTPTPKSFANSTTKIKGRSASGDAKVVFYATPSPSQSQSISSHLPPPPNHHQNCSSDKERKATTMTNLKGPSSSLFFGNTKKVSDLEEKIKGDDIESQKKLDRFGFCNSQEKEADIEIKMKRRNKNTLNNFTFRDSHGSTATVTTTTTITPNETVSKATQMDAITRNNWTMMKDTRPNRYGIKRGPFPPPPPPPTINSDTCDSMFNKNLINVVNVVNHQKEDYDFKSTRQNLNEERSQIYNQITTTTSSSSSANNFQSQRNHEFSTRTKMNREEVRNHHRSFVDRPEVSKYKSHNVSVVCRSGVVTKPESLHETSKLWKASKEGGRREGRERWK